PISALRIKAVKVRLRPADDSKSSVSGPSLSRKARTTMAFSISAPASAGLAASLTVAPKSAVAAPASSDLSGASSAKVAANGPAPDKALLAKQTAKAVAKAHLATLAANKQLAAKQAANGAAGAEEA